MVEILVGTLNITLEQVPPRARGTVELALRSDRPANPQETEWLTRSIKDMLYPGWTSYEGYKEGELPEHLYPFYRVFCQTPEQAFVAQALKPRRAVVETVMLEDFQRAEEERKTNPFVRKLKSINPRWWWAANIELTGFSVMSLINSAAAYSNGKPEIGYPFMVLGAGLGLASMVLEGARSGYLHLPHIEISFGRDRNNLPAVR